MIECLIEKILYSFTKENGIGAERVSATMKDAILYIHTHFQKHITLDEVARVAKYNSSYFSTAFKADVGVTFSEYLTKLRVDYAKRLLVSTDEVVNEIGKRSGFLSSSTFLQSFKKYENMTPTAYRNKNK
jgi:YesN/AraC family two-component response regulator